MWVGPYGPALPLRSCKIKNGPKMTFYRIPTTFLLVAHLWILTFSKDRQVEEEIIKYFCAPPTKMDKQFVKILFTTTKAHSRKIFVFNFYSKSTTKL